MASEDRAEENDLDPTPGGEHLSPAVSPQVWDASEPAVASPVPLPVHSLDAKDARRGEERSAQPSPAPAPVAMRRLEPQTGKTLIASSRPEPVPARRGGLEPQTGKTLIASSRPEPVPARRGWMEPRTGKTLIANPKPPTAPATTSRLQPHTDPARIDDAALAPPESQRLAGRRVAPSTVPRAQRSAWVGGYEVLARLHRSPRGTVYLCRPADDPTARYTLTVLRHRLSTWAERDAFLRYANRLAKRVHPSLLEPVDAGVCFQQPYLVRPQLEGVTFDRLLAATPTGSRSPRLVLPIFEAALEALAVVHERRLVGSQPVHFVHGALAADQLLITTTGRTLVTGVGEATVIGSGANDASEDLLALGILINEALSGGKEKALLQDRWLEDARAGRSAQAADLLSELRRLKERTGVHVPAAEIADWVASVKRSARGRPPTSATRDPSPSSAPLEAAPPRFKWLTAVKSWWARRGSN